MSHLQVKNIPDALHRQLQRAARRRKQTVRDVVLEAVKRELSHEEFVARLRRRPAVDLRRTAADLLREARARGSLGDLRDWPMRRLPHGPLLHAAWDLRHNLSAYDALYAAAARLHDATVLTADGPLSRAPRMGIMVENVRV